MFFIQHGVNLLEDYYYHIINYYLVYAQTYRQKENCILDFLIFLENVYQVAILASSCVQT